MLSCPAPVYSAASLDQALALRAAHPEAVPLAGGTDLMVALEAGQAAAPAYLNLWGCAGLRAIQGDAAAGLRLGALTTFRDLVDHPAIPAVLQDTARTIGAAQIQARATLGGNIANASPAGDSLPVWLALGARFVLASVRGERTVSADSFFLGYRKVDLAADELLVAIEVPPWQHAGGVDRHVYRKVGTRLAQAISKVVFAGSLRLVDGRVTEARLAMGSVAPVPTRLRSVEALLIGRAPDPAAVDRVLFDIKPIDDVRSTAEYRLNVARGVLRTWLEAEAAAVGR